MVPVYCIAMNSVCVVTHWALPHCIVLPHIATFPSWVPSLPNSKIKGIQYTLIALVTPFTPLLGIIMYKVIWWQMAKTRRFIAINVQSIAMLPPH